MRKEKTAKRELLDNGEAFALMTRSAAMLGSKKSEIFCRDAAVLIDLIGKAYGWPPERIDAATTVILGDMMRVGLVSDYLALGSAEVLDESTRENMVFFEIKGRAIEEVNRSDMIAATTGQRAEYEIKNSMGYAAFHHPYEPRIRFSQIKKAADSGEMTAMLQEALMLICGVGCDGDIVSAQWLLQSLLVWGEKPAALLLSFLWGREDNEPMRRYYKKIYDSVGNNRPVFDGDVPADRRDDADRAVVIMAAIQSVIVKGAGRREVDTLFADLINGENLSFEGKIELIKKYKDGSWLNKLKGNDVKRPIGFVESRKRRPDYEMLKNALSACALSDCGRRRRATLHLGRGQTRVYGQAF